MAPHHPDHIDDPDTFDVDVFGDPELASVLTAEEVAFAAELCRLYPADDDEDDVLYADDFDLDEAEAAVNAAAVRAAATRGPGCGAGDLALLERLDPTTLTDPLARIAYVQVLDRVEAAVHARRYDTVLSLVPVLARDHEYEIEDAIKIDLAVASRSSFAAARTLIDVARASRLVFPAMHAALAAGQVSDRHLRILVERTKVIGDAAVLALIGEQALPLARQLTPARFTDALEQVIVAFDPDAPTRRRKARTTRDVWTCRLPDGMAAL